MFSVNCSGVTATTSSLAGVDVGTSGWSYPSWKPDVYPAGTDAKEFLSFYAQRFSTVELNTTGYRLPAEEQFRRWADQTPAGFRFAPKLAGNRPRMVAEFGARVRLLGDRLGPVRVQLISARDEGTQQVELGQIRLSNASVTVDEPGPADPFSATLKKAADLLLFDSRAGALQRVKVTGTLNEKTRTVKVSSVEPETGSK